jgi:hypothetical protein
MERLLAQAPAQCLQKSDGLLLAVPVLWVYAMGMAGIQDARRILSEAETKLRELITAALNEQRYADVAHVAGLADGVARLLGGVAVVPGVTTLSAGGHTPDANEHRPSRGSKRPKKAYPRFERDGDKLVKIGWSKKNKSSYEHRAPREAVIAFTRHLAGSADEGKVFVVEDLLPVPDVANGGEIPAYQIYLTLAWLRDVGAVAKKGRDGYVLRGGGLANGALDKFWASLPARVA